MLALVPDCLGRGFRNIGIGHGERVAVPRVEPLRQVTGEFQMLALILTDRHQIRLIQQDVRCLQDGIREQTDALSFSRRLRSAAWRPSTTEAGTRKGFPIDG